MKGATVKEIPLTRGKVALVDDEDYERVAQFRWRTMMPDPRFANFYAVRTRYEKGRRKNGILVSMQSFILGTKELIDHKNGNGLDNRKDNLRPSTSSQNSANTKKRTGTASQFKGVTRSRKNRWEARIGFQGQRHSLGSYKTEREAALAYNQAAIKFFGAFARLNPV